MNKIRRLIEQVSQLIFSKEHYSNYLERKIEGAVINSKHFDGAIIVTRYYSNTKWYFRRYNMIKDKAYGLELRAQTRFNFFEENGLVLWYSGGNKNEKH